MKLEIIKLWISTQLMDLYKAPDGGLLYSSPDQLNKGQALGQPAHGSNEFTFILQEVRAFNATFQEPHTKADSLDQCTKKQNYKTRHDQTLQ